MDEELVGKIRSAAKAAGLIDDSAIAVFASITAGIKDDAGIPAAIDQMKTVKPALFRARFDDSLSDAEYARREEELMRGLRHDRPLDDETANLVKSIRSVNAARLSPADFESLDSLLSCVSQQTWNRIDPAEVSRLQKVSA